MAEIGLQGSGIDALVSQRVAAGMPEHVWVDLEPSLVRLRTVLQGFETRLIQNAAPYVDTGHALGAHEKPAALCNLSLAPSKLHTTIALLPYARRCWHRRIGPALGYDLKPLNRDAA